MKKGFNNDKYLKLQIEKILKRVGEFNNKLYIEFGGKLFDDNHASRVLPGFEKNAKIEVMKKLKKKLEVLFVISAKDIEKNKMRSDLGIAYEMDVLRQIDKLSKMDILANKIVITQYEGEKAAETFKNKVERRNIKVYIHTYTKGYPTDIETIVSEEGYGANPYIETDMPIVVVTAPGASSGKLSTCLSQIYHEYTRGVEAGYAKYETFPIWNLPLKHPINMAYEAATADIKDVNMIDSFHLDKYGIKTVNYNRDLAVFPVLKTILNKIYGKDIFYSPTDMGINMVGFAIENEEVCCDASKEEIIRRYYHHLCEYKKGIGSQDACQKIEMIMSEMEINTSSRKVIKKANDKFKDKKELAIAIELPNKKIVTGRNTEIMTSGASVVLNAIKSMAKINDNIHLISPTVLEPMQKLKGRLFNNGDALLNIYDVLTALSYSASTNPTVELCLAKLEKLSGCEAHASHIIPINDYQTFKNLKVNLTQEAEYFSKKLYEE